MMFKTLRAQLVLSHILPSLVIIPLMGIALVYFLENKLVLPRLESQLADDAEIINRFARSQPQIFKDSQLAGFIILDLELKTATRIMILDPQGILLASSDPADAYRLNQVLDAEGVAQARLGRISKHLDISKGLHGEVLDVFAPVIDQESQLIGIMRLSYRFSTVVEQLMGIRYLIFWILMIGAVSSAVLGLLLALNISHPIQQVTSAIVDLTYGVRTDQLAVQGFTETKKLQQAVNFLVARLRELEQNRRQLLANLIHEIGRPLGGLRMGIQVLRRGAKTDPQVLDELLEGMEMETGILTRLLEDLSLLHDQIIGTLELNFQTVSLSDWLPGVLYSIQEAAHRKGLNCIVDIPKDLPNIRIDPQRIAQAIGNLTANAIKYTPREGTVSISAGESGKLVWIRVSDTGPGIPIEEQEKIFEPFFRGTQRKRIKHGMGLGLNIARDFVTAHQGRLEVDSAPGLGSHFTIWLPKLMELENPSSDVKVAASNE